MDNVHDDDDDDDDEDNRADEMKKITNERLQQNAREHNLYIENGPFVIPKDADHILEQHHYVEQINHLL